MIGGARRQLPSWMVRPVAADQATGPEMEEENKENDSKELDAKACRPHKKVQRNQQDSEVQLPETKSHLLKNREARRNKRNSTMLDEEDQSNNQGDSDLANKGSIKARKKFHLGDQPPILKKCETSKRKRISNKRCEDQRDENDMETKVSAELRKKHQCNAPNRKKQKAEAIMDRSHGVASGSVPSDDELTVDDLISIAEEYLNADKVKELQKTPGVGYRSETQPLITSISTTGSEEDLTGHPESRTLVKDEELSTTCSLMKPSYGDGSIINPRSTGDPARDMLDLFLGPLLRTAEAMERKTDSITEKY